MCERTEAAFCWQECEDGTLCIRRVYGASPVVVVPEMVAGRKVTRLGDYCFSDSARAFRMEPGGDSFSNTGRVSYMKQADREGQKSEGCIIRKGSGRRDGKIRFTDVKGKDLEKSPEGLQELAGRDLEQLILPDSLQAVGDFAFYNCSRLRSLSMGTALIRFGSDAFMNCASLHTVTLRGSMGQASGLKQLLCQRMVDTEVVFEQAGTVDGKVFYPEYDEMYDEIGPAHIFAMSLRGEGFRARQSFQDGVLDLAGYDGVFEQACAEESEKTLCHMAWNRLYYPVNLSEAARQRYKGYLKEHEMILLKELLNRGAIEELLHFIREHIVSEKVLTEGIKMASELEMAEGVAQLMCLQQQMGQKKRENRYQF